MKIGLISFHSFAHPGGVKKHILGLHKEFKRIGVDSKIIAPRRSREEDYGEDVILLGTSFPVDFGGAKSDLCINFNSPTVDKVLKAEKFDVLHYHNFGLPSAIQILEKSRALNILTFHSNIMGSRLFESHPELLYALRKLIQWKIDGIIGVADLSLDFFKGYQSPKTVIPNGIDLTEFNPQVPKIEKYRDGKINILFAGRIEDRKGLIYLLKAYKILPQAGIRLIIAGEGNLKKECQQWAKENYLKNVHFEDPDSQDKFPSYFSSADIYVSPAPYGESFGIVLVEAMASGTPLVGFANQGYQELLQGTKGQDFLVPPKDHEALAKKIKLLIEDKKLRQEMGQWGIEEAKQYSWEKVAQDVLKFYQLCQEKKDKRKKTIFPLQEIDSILQEIDKILEKKIIGKKDILAWKNAIVSWLKKNRPSF